MKVTNTPLSVPNRMPTSMETRIARIGGMFILTITQAITIPASDITAPLESSIAAGDLDHDHDPNKGSAG